MDKFVLKSPFQLVEEQRKAVEVLTRGLNDGVPAQALLGVTGSGKTFTIANVIKNVNRPALVISHNKTLAAQLYSELKEFFPTNAVEYFVSYYDYYQPEAYIPQTDIYIEKDSSINDRLDRLRLAATTSLMSRRDTIIVASVSCIYNLGSPDDYQNYMVQLKSGQKIDRDEVLAQLIGIQYERNDYEFARGKIRVRGDIVEVHPAYRQDALRIEFYDDEIEKIKQIDPVSGDTIALLDRTFVYPAKHFLISPPRLQEALVEIEAELKDRLEQLESQGKLVEAQRLKSRTRYDMEMMKEIGMCKGIENYSRVLSGRPAGSKPFCLMDYFPSDFVTIIDESHVTVPQLGGMYEGDRARKEMLVAHGFRLPSCLDNRPLKFHEVEEILKQRIYVSATPGPYERKDVGSHVVEQIIRPTGIIDPPIFVRPTEGQVDDLIKECQKRASKNERVLVTTLTKRMSEDLCAYCEDAGLKVKYLHSDIETIDRTKILQDLRLKKFDCLIGVNLLREGLDLPEVSLVAIFDADKQGFLRSQTSLIQTAGRAARNINGIVIMYADSVSPAMRSAIAECERRRKIQIEFNSKHGITPTTIAKAINLGIEEFAEAEDLVMQAAGQTEEEFAHFSYLSDLEQQMESAARNLEFEKAAKIRDKIKVLKMLLALDIGNTTIGFAVMDKAGRIVSSAIIDTDAKTNKIKAVVAKILRAHVISQAVICSVVPKASKMLEDILKKHMPVDIIGRDIVVPIKNCYKNPKQVGQDRLVGAYGAMKIYGFPLIVVDLGTAITFDVVSPKGEYLGGAIVPGLRLSAESLFLKTALLPHIEIQAPRHIIGKTTQESMLSGLFYGYGSLCRGVIDLISQQMKAKPKVVMTGGHTHLMKKFVSPKIRIIDEDLVFKGIYFLSNS